MINTVLFDLDGTLTDSKEGILNCVRYALEQLHRPIPDPAALFRFIGPPLGDSFRQWCGMDEAESRRAVEIFRERYRPVGMFENAPGPGCVDLCRRLWKRGLTLAVASSKPESMCVPICERFGFAPYMRTIVGSPPGDDWNKVQVITEALSRLGRADGDSSVLMVGDRKYDVLGAAAHGLPCVGVEFFGYAEPGELESAGAVTVVRTAEELEAYILSH